MNPDTNVTYQKVNLFSPIKCLSPSFLMFHITFDEISLILSMQFCEKVDTLDTLYVHTLESYFCYFP